MLEVNEDLMIEHYRKELKRTAWRLQYAVRKQRAKELLIAEEKHRVSSFENNVISDVFIQWVNKQISSPKGQYIFKRSIVDGATEKEVAEELKISQQAVSKWKKKIRKQLLEKMNPSCL
ncbi:hypothetical protein ACFLFF_30510 [Brevibacillus reuszeri]|uniref:hypothetical protein n=1 Tax=Brevibacillus reuszeri TaxID=54915 RepID=UPI00366AB5A4